MPPRSLGSLRAMVAGLAGWLSAGNAAAQELSTDVALVRPTFGGASFAGVAVARGEPEPTVRIGLLAEYQRAPVVLFDPESQVVGALVKNRAAFLVGLSVDVSPRVNLHLALPAANSWGSDLEGGNLDGFGFGDVAAGVRFNLLDSGEDRAARFLGGLRAGALAPTGRRAAFLGEESLRGTAGLLASLDVGPLRAATDLGVMLRQVVRTDVDFEHGSEIVWGNGVRLALPEASRTAVTAQLLSRFGLRNFLGGGAETAVEGLAGVQVVPDPHLAIDLAGGRGFNQGAGTTEYRALSAITFQIPRPRPDAEPPLAGPDALPPPPPPPPLEVPDSPPPPEPAWEEGELARITDDREHIVIRDRLEFQVGTHILLERSRPTLVAVADILNAEATIGHVVIEGHASEEGSFEQNYELSLGRARVIFEELLREGVHPDRISFRGMGEVEPMVGPHEGASAEENEALLQANRRVEFHIVRYFEDLYELPRYRTEGNRQPWSGQPYAVKQPPPPPAAEGARPPPGPPPEPAEPEFTQPKDEEFELKREGPPSEVSPPGEAPAKPPR